MKTPIALIVNCNLSLQFQTKLSRFPRPERRGEGIAGKDKFRLRNSFTLQMLQMRWNFLRNLKPSASSAILKEYHFVPWHVSFTVYFLCSGVCLFLTLQLKSGSCPGPHVGPPATFTQTVPSKNSVNFELLLDHVFHQVPSKLEHSLIFTAYFRHMRIMNSFFF